MVIGRAAFMKLLRAEPRIAEALLRTLASRLRAAQAQD
jgi:CRP-like cAMP-binding protein